MSNCKEPSCSGEANSHSASQITRVLRNPTVRVRKSTPPRSPVLISSQMQPVHTFSVGIALRYGLDDRGSRVRFPVGAENFSLHHRVQNGSGVHPAS
jgi:hypothetical protein